MAKQGKKPQPKTQKQLSREFQNPYTNPETGETRGNPNDGGFDPNNRGNHTSFRGDDTKLFTLGLKEIDEAIFYYINNVIKPTIIQNGIKQKVPLIYGSAEKWKQIQKDGYYRDKEGKIMLPLITFKRKSINKNKNLTNKLDANFPNNLQIFTKKFTPKNNYNQFNILNNQVPKTQYYAVVVPDYLTVTYDFIISTYYIEQLNKLIESINYASDSYWGDPKKFKFKANIDDFSTPVETNDNGERSVKANFELKLYGYIVPEVTQKELSSIKKYSSKNQLIFNTEIVDNLENI